jgi:putative ABC transport system permease protein
VTHGYVTDRQQEASHASRGSLDSFRQDLRYGLRLLRKQPGFTAACVLTLALGIGANTAIFSIVNAALLTPVAIPEPERVVMVWTDKVARGTTGFPASGPDFLDWQASGIFERLAGFSTDGYNLLIGTRPERVQGAAVTREWFEVLRTRPYLGRVFQADDMQPGHDREVLLTYGFWRSRFGGKPDIVGRTVLLNSAAYDVIGVLPPRTPLAAEEQLYVPLVLEPPLGNNRGLRWIGAMGRLAPGMSFAAAQSGINALSMRLERQYPNEDGGFRARLQPVEEAYVENVHTLVLVLFGAVGFVLLVACANIANLLLVRGASRRKEIAIRAALGASRRRVLQQLLIESVLLALAGAATGIVPALFGIRFLAHYRPDTLPNADLIGLNPAVLLFTLALAVATGLLFGSIPAWIAWRASGTSPLRERAQISTREMKLGNAFVIAEIAITMILLSGAVLMLRTIAKLQAANPGYDTRALTLRVSLTGKQYDAPENQIQFYNEVLRRIRDLPGVRAAGAIDSLPTSNDLQGGTLHFTDRPEPKQSEAAIVIIGSATPDYFKAMHIPLMRGRFFDESDKASSAPVVILDEATARKYWVHEDPIGRSVRLRLHDPLRRIIGVVGNIDRSMAVKLKTRIGQVYVPFEQSPAGDMSIAISCGINPAAIVPEVRRRIATLAPDQPIYKVQTMSEARAATQISSRFSACLLAFFAAVSLLLAAVGIYGVVAYMVEQRKREIAIRTALGATRGVILVAIIRTGALLTSAGAAAGVAGALVLTRTMRGLLYGVTAGDPASLIAAVAALGMVAMAATFIPAARASRIEPALALREN